MTVETSQPPAASKLGHVLPLLRCPESGQRLIERGDELVSEDGTHRYGKFQGIPDLRRPPQRLLIDLPWYEPWDDLKQLDFAYPQPLHSPDLPFHLDAYQAGIAGPQGNGRRILEIGCAARHTEPYFKSRGFEYVGTDYDKRGQGPHVMADGRNLPFADESFDLCYAMAVYEHLICPLTATVESFRVLKPGGTFFGSAAFVYGFHDVASFHHMSSAGLLCVLKAAGFEDVRIWPGWPYYKAIPSWAFCGASGTPWRVFSGTAMALSEWSYTTVSNVIRRMTGKKLINLQERRSQIAGGLNFAARKP